MLSAYACNTNESNNDANEWCHIPSLVHLHFISNITFTFAEKRKEKYNLQEMFNLLTSKIIF